MHEGVSIVDEAGALIYVNDRLCEMTGRTRDELVGKGAVHFFYDEEQERHTGWVARHRVGLSERYESVLAGQGGTQVPVLISASPLVLQPELG